MHPPSQPPAFLSVVFVTYNSAESIGAAILSVYHHLPNAEIIVVDNDSTDETCRLAIEAADPTRLLRGHGNVGFGAAVNLGVAAATNELVLILNPDTAVIHADIAQLGEMSHCPALGALACLIYKDDGNRHLEYAEWGWRRELSWALLRWFLLPPKVTLRRPDPRSTRSRLWISGAAFIVNRTEFLEIGGFDEDLFLYFEDADLSKRYRQHGAGVGTTEAVMVTHTGQGSLSPHHQERVQSWALLSLLQLVAKWQGQAESERAAKLMLSLLNAIVLLGKAATRLPVVGRRALVKSRSAELVKAELLTAVDRPPASGAYRQARSAIATVTSEDTSVPPSPKIHGISLWNLICTDLARTNGRLRPSSVTGQMMLLLATLPTVKSLAVIGFRISHAVGKRNGTVGGIIKQVTHLLTGADIGFRASIGPGLRLLHPTGVVIANETVVGDNCTIHQGVTLGGSPDGAPIVGNLVNLAPGARVLGAVRIGNGVRIGANCVVTKTFDQDNVVLVGVPAHVLRATRPDEIRHAMAYVVPTSRDARDSDVQ